MTEAHAILSRQELLDAGFQDPEAAMRRIRRLVHIVGSEITVAELLPSLIRALQAGAHPDEALVYVERLFAVSKGPATLARFLASRPRALEMAVTIFAGSRFLAEILIRYPHYLEWMVEARHLAVPHSREYFYLAAQAARQDVETFPEELDALRTYQRWELLRVGACDFFGLMDVPTITSQLSHLADALIRHALVLAGEHTGLPTEGFAVLAFGKLGGQELNYSSDIDLVFLADGGAASRQRLGQSLIDVLSRMTGEGFLYRVDMRLRPWGRSGPLVITPDAYVRYLEQHARLWEKQALLKARVVAGTPEIGHNFLRRIQPLLFGDDPDTVRREVRAMKARIEAGLRARGQTWGEVKLGAGSIRDVEFTVQLLQLVHGRECPDIRTPNTLDALGRLTAAGLLAPEEYRVLADGYVFLRTVEHYVQLMHNQQTHQLPQDEAELTALARRLGFEGQEAGEQLVERYEEHCRAIREVYRTHVEAVPKRATFPPPGGTDIGDAIGHHVARMAPSYQEAFSEEEIARHVALAASLDEDHLVWVEAARLDGDYEHKDGSPSRWRVTIVGYDYLGALSIICGLFFAYGFNILDGQVFTYEAGDEDLAAPGHRRKIVDVFTVQAAEPVSNETWARYADDVRSLFRLLHRGRRREARGALARLVAERVQPEAEEPTTLYPIHIDIDNQSSSRYTILRIDAPDTMGFLYEFTNALALSRVYIARVEIASSGNRVHDILYVTDHLGRKITDPEAQRRLRAATVLVKHFTHLLPRSPNPRAALQQFREFLDELFCRPNWPDEIASLEQTEVLQALARLLGVSEFLWEDFLRLQHDNLFPVVRDVDHLAAGKPRRQMARELAALLAQEQGGEARRQALNAFKDREMFRIDMRYILGHTPSFHLFSQELTDLAEVVVEATYRLCEEELEARHGIPVRPDGTSCALVICALGKCGGRELGVASDIELMFIFDGTGETTGPDIITAAEFYEKLVASFVKTLRSRRQGIFEVDLRLRPYGRSGSLAVPLSLFERYFAPEGPAWPYERQALVKLRPFAGDVELGARVVQLRDAFVYTGTPFDVAAMRAMRERQVRHLVRGGTFNAKFSPGGLVDVEYLVQGLQITHGHRHFALRTPNTRTAMSVLAELGILGRQQYAHLREAYIFLRQLIEALRIVRGNADDLTVPPEESEEFAYLARRLGYGRHLADLRADLERYTGLVQELARTLLPSSQAE
ncbi:MAG: glutamine synthetase adenylyltransferase [Ardenticatenia bacterium]|nr:glutamine synthetase adenylyltransferase [Ardenticatenia bacterium]